MIASMPAVVPEKALEGRTFTRAASFLTTGLAVLSLAGVLTSPAHAWKPKTHIYLAEEALKDALDNGKVTIYETDYKTGRIIGRLGEFEVDAKILASLKAAPQQYRAGVLGPDAYPDILTGQQIIHPEESTALDGAAGGTNAWLAYLWNRSRSSSLEVQAFTVGYLTHAAGDVFAHTFVNHFAGGEFTLIPDPTNAVKHLILEGYIGKRTAPTLGANGVQITQNDTSISGVEGFIYDEMTFSRPGSLLEQKLLKGDGTSRSIPFIFSSLRNGLQKQVEEYDRIRLSKRGPARLAYSIANGPAAEYKRSWIKDIDDGLKAWPAVSHELGKALVYNENGSDMPRAKEIMNQYVREHLASMAGTPDAVVATVGFISDVISAILPQALRDQFKELMRAPLDFIAKGITGKSLTEWENYLKNPETHFDPILNQSGGGHDGEADHRIDLATFNRDYLKISDTSYQNPSQKWQIDQLPPAFNSLQMCKMLILGQTGMNELVAALRTRGASAVPAPNTENIMLGWVRSLDAGNQWQGFASKKGGASPQPFFAQNNGAAYRKLFLPQVGERQWLSDSSNGGGTGTHDAGPVPTQPQPPPPGQATGTQPPVSSTPPTPPLPVPVPVTTVPVTPVPAPPVTEVFTGDGQFRHLSQVDVRVDKITSGRGGRIEVFFTFRNTTKASTRLMGGSLDLWLFDAEGIGWRDKGRLYRTGGTTLEEAGILDFEPDDEVKIRYVWDAVGGMRTLKTLRVQDRTQFEKAPVIWDLASFTPRGATASTPPANLTPVGDGQFAELGDWDFRFDGATKTNNLVELFFTFRNTTDVPKDFTPGHFPMRLTDTDGSSAITTSSFFRATGEKERIVTTLVAAPGGEARVSYRYTLSSPNAGPKKLTIESGSAKLSFDLSSVH